MHACGGVGGGIDVGVVSLQVSSPRLSDLKRGVWKEDADFSGHELLLPGRAQW